MAFHDTCVYLTLSEMLSRLFTDETHHFLPLSILHLQG